MAQFGGTPWSNPQMWNASYGYNSGPTRQGQQALNWFAQQPQQNPYSPGQVNPAQAIQSAVPGIQEQMNKNFATAASRLGRPATQRSSPYQTAFGNVARGASNDLANITNQYMYDASKFNAGQAQDWATNQYNTGAGAASQGASQGFGREQMANQTQQDWWQRYYDWYLRGGSPSNMNYWQGAGQPLVNQYMQGYR